MPSHPRSLCCWMASLAFVIAIAGCAIEVAPIEVAAGCPEQPLREPSKLAAAPEQELIDDFEHESTSLPRLGGRDGSWILGSEPSEAPPRARVSDQCAGRGQRAGHFFGGDFSSWGANWTAVLRTQPTGTAVPYDATPYGGISFWAAVGADTPTPLSMPVGVTTMDVAWNGGICATCMDYYRTEISLGPVWRRYELRFEDLVQDGSGDPIVPLRLDQLVGLIFWPNRDFDLWIDDVRFEQ